MNLRSTSSSEAFAVPTKRHCQKRAHVSREALRAIIFVFLVLQDARADGGADLSCGSIPDPYVSYVAGDGFIELYDVLRSRVVYTFRSPQLGGEAQLRPPMHSYSHGRIALASEVADEALDPGSYGTRLDIIDVPIGTEYYVLNIEALCDGYSVSALKWNRCATSLAFLLSPPFFPGKDLHLHPRPRLTRQPSVVLPHRTVAGLRLRGDSLRVQGSADGLSFGLLDLSRGTLAMRPLRSISVTSKSGTPRSWPDRSDASSSLEWSPNSAQLLVEVDGITRLVDLHSGEAIEFTGMVRSLSWSPTLNVIAALGVRSPDVSRDEAGHASARIGPETIVILRPDGELDRKFPVSGEYSLGSLAWIDGSRDLVYTCMRARTLGVVPIEELHLVRLDAVTGKRRSLRRIGRRSGP